MICTGRGDTDGGHCCWIHGEICEFLFVNRGGWRRCRLHSDWGNLTELAEWANAPIGQWFAENHPGYDCGDWPQNIPEVMAKERGLCCWNETVEVNLGNMD